MLNLIYNQTVLDEIRSNAYVYLHGVSTGGTNPSLVEAMYLGLPSQKRLMKVRVEQIFTTPKNS